MFEKYYIKTLPQITTTTRTTEVYSRNYWVSVIKNQGGITCGAIDEPRKSSKAIDERVIINFRDKNVVIARFCDKNVVIARFRDKNVVIARFRDKNVVIGWEYYPLKSA